MTSGTILPKDNLVKDDLSMHSIPTLDLYETIKWVLCDGLTDL